MLARCLRIWHSSTAEPMLTISGTPEAVAQAVPFTIEVTDSASQSAAQPYTVSIVLEPDTLTFSPPSLSFLPPQQVIGTASAAQTETLPNTGTSEVVISNIALTGVNATDFSQSNTCGSNLAAGANCDINVTFTPSQLGPRSASVTITDNTTGSPTSVALSGLGLTSGSDATLSTTSLTFGNQSPGTTSSAQSITLSNYGTMALSSVNIDASTNFGETSTCDATLPSGADCTIHVTFTPRRAGTSTGTLSVTDNAADSPQTCSLKGSSCVKEGNPCSSASGSPYSCCSGLVCRSQGINAGLLAAHLLTVFARMIDICFSPSSPPLASRPLEWAHRPQDVARKTTATKSLIGTCDTTRFIFAESINLRHLAR